MGIDSMSVSEGTKVLTEIPIVRFKLGNTNFGFNVTAVQDIIKLEPFTRVPNALNYIRGVINYRGQIIPIISLRKRFNMSEEKDTDNTRILVVNYAGETIGILADQVHEVLNLQINNILPTPRYFQVRNNMDAIFLQGLGKFTKVGMDHEEIVLILNLPKVLNIEEDPKLKTELDKIIARKTKMLEEQREFLRKKLIQKKKKMDEKQKLRELTNTQSQTQLEQKRNEIEQKVQEAKIKRKNRGKAKKKIDPVRVETAEETTHSEPEIDTEVNEKQPKEPETMILETDEGFDLSSDDGILDFINQTENEIQTEKETHKKPPEAISISGTVYEMNEIQASALQEVGNICTGNAANALSTMIDKIVKINIPSTEIVHSKEVVNMVGQPNQWCIGVYVEIVGDLYMYMMLVFDKMNALRLADQLLMASRSEEELEAISKLGPMDESALMEVGNILGSHYLTALSSMTGLDVTPSTPAISYDMLGALLDSLIIRLSEASDIAVVLNTIFYIEDQEMDGYFLIFPTPESIGDIFDRLGLN
ncbi:MAG: hypothetical protein GY870_03425 [archaeon]|nr:hypothetical protein [archaeon]